MVGTPRLRRLYADWQAVQEQFTGHPHIQVRPLYGNPPEAYEVIYRVPGVALDPATNRPVIRREHRVGRVAGLEPRDLIADVVVGVGVAGLEAESKRADAR